MSETLFSFDSFLKKVASLPVIQQMVREKTQEEVAQALDARKACILALKDLHAKEAAALQAVESALVPVRNAESKLESLRSVVAVASNAHQKIATERAALDLDLLMLHGEKHVYHALHVIHILINECKQKIINLTNAINPVTTDPDGSFRFHIVKPETRVWLEERKVELKKLEKIYSDTTRLINFEATSEELQARCKELLHSAGYKINTDPDTFQWLE